MYKYLFSPQYPVPVDPTYLLHPFNILFYVSLFQIKLEGSLLIKIYKNCA